MGSLNRSRALLICGLLAALTWGLSAYFARAAPLAVAVPASDPNAFGAWAGSSAVRFAASFGVLSQLLLIFGAFGLVVAVQSGPGARKVFFGALLVSLGQVAGIASAGVALFVYPRVASLVAEGRLEAVDVVGVMPMGAVTISVMSTVVGAFMQALGVWRNSSLSQWSGWFVATGTTLSLVPGGGAATTLGWVSILSVWLAGWAGLLWSKPRLPRQVDQDLEAISTGAHAPSDDSELHEAEPSEPESFDGR